MLVFGGCYGNLEATQAVFSAARRLEIPPRSMICTGDVVAYCADPRATIDLVRDAGVRVIMGNCEESLSMGAFNCGCGFAEGTACERLASAWYEYADLNVDAEARAWMGALPRRLDLKLGKKRIAVVHGSAQHINAFVFASDGDLIAEQLAAGGCDGVFAGHAGLPFTRILDKRIWHNAGAIGMPANDGTPRTWFSLIVRQGDRLTIRHLPLDYDHVAAARKMRAVTLLKGYADALESGFWPSCDVLPFVELKQRGHRMNLGEIDWVEDDLRAPPPPVPITKPKFLDPDVTATGEQRAQVGLVGLRTLWFNTGTLCNLACKGCYIESNPRNDRLTYLGRQEVRRFLDEARARSELQEIGFTGGEPFMNPEILDMIEDSLASGWRVLVLTNAMAPMQRRQRDLLDINRWFPGRLFVRVSMDHYSPEKHEQIRGVKSWEPTIKGIRWLSTNGFQLALAGRLIWDEGEAKLRDGYSVLFKDLGLALDAHDPARLVLFPEMDQNADVPEITEHCWGILGKSPDSVMCANSRMVVKHRGADRPSVVSCTLLPYEPAFDLGGTLAEADRPVKLNHPHCAKFCVLGGASCSMHADPS